MSDQPGFARGGFRDVDGSGVASYLVAYLDAARSNPAVALAKRWSIEHLELSPGARALDVGCGTGEDVMTMSTLVGASGTAHGVDSSRVMVTEASQRARQCGPVPLFHVGDAHSLAFDSRAFDAARVERTLQHVDDPDQAVREVSRVLKPGGRVAIIEPDWETLVIEGGDPAVSAAVRSACVERTAHPRLGRRLYGLLNANGFVDVEITAVVVTITSLAHGSTAYGLDRDVHRAVDIGTVAPPQAEAWLEDLRRSGATGQFLWGLANFCAAGRKPLPVPNPAAD